MVHVVDFGIGIDPAEQGGLLYGSVGPSEGRGDFLARPESVGAAADGHRLVAVQAEALAVCPFGELQRPPPFRRGWSGGCARNSRR